MVRVRARRKINSLDIKNHDSFLLPEMIFVSDGSKYFISFLIITANLLVSNDAKTRTKFQGYFTFAPHTYNRFLSNAET